jgi:hypothetical protein
VNAGLYEANHDWARRITVGREMHFYVTRTQSRAKEDPTNISKSEINNIASYVAA